MKSFGPPSPLLRSPDFSAIRGARLTDSRISHYIKQGYYGESRRVALLAATAKRSSRVPKQSNLDAALSLLAKL